MPPKMPAAIRVEVAVPLPAGCVRENGGTADEAVSELGREGSVFEADLSVPGPSLMRAVVPGTAAGFGPVFTSSPGVLFGARSGSDSTVDPAVSSVSLLRTGAASVSCFETVASLVPGSDPGLVPELDGGGRAVDRHGLLVGLRAAGRFIRDHRDLVPASLQGEVRGQGQGWEEVTEI